MKPVKLTAVFVHLDSDLIPIKKRSKLKPSATPKAQKSAKKQSESSSSSSKEELDKRK